MNIKDYGEYATARQKDYIQAYEELGSVIAVAEKLGVDKSTVSYALKSVRDKAAKRGFAPEADMSKGCPDGFKIKGVSTLYDNEGNPKIQWVKTSEDRERQFELMQEAVEALTKDLPKLPKRLKKKERLSKDYMAFYPLGDPHIGMLAWAEETGQDWDLKIAQSAFLGVFDRLVKSAPKCENAAIINLGDFFHYDNMEGVTTRSGHSLDVDGRYGKMVDVGIKIMRRLIESALDHHGKVTVINAIGNHDDTSSIFMAQALSHIYEKEPRVIINKDQTPFHYIEFGNSAIGVHHGHTAKSMKLPGVMAADKPEMWGRTKYRHWYTGHIHHDTLTEYSGCTVETFRTLAAKDAYATWGGYRALQDSKCIVHHIKHGEVERHTINLAAI